MNAFWIFLDEQKKNVVCSQPSSWIISRALSNQNIIGLTNISIVLKPEPNRTTVCKRMEWVRGHFWNSSLMIGQKGQIWSTEKCFLRHFLVHTHTLTKSLNMFCCNFTKFLNIKNFVKLQHIMWYFSNSKSFRTVW